MRCRVMRPMEFHRVWHLQQQMLRAHICRRHARVVANDADEIDLITLRRKKKVDVQASSSSAISIPVYLTGNRERSTTVSEHVGMDEGTDTNAKRMDGKGEALKSGLQHADANANTKMSNNVTAVQEPSLDASASGHGAGKKGDDEARLLESITAQSIRANYKEAAKASTAESPSSNNTDSLRRGISKMLREDNKRQHEKASNTSVSTSTPIKNIFSAHNRRVEERLKSIAHGADPSDTASTHTVEAEMARRARIEESIKGQPSARPHQLNQEASSPSTSTGTVTLLPIAREYLLQSSTSRMRFSSRLPTRQKSLTELLGQVNLASLTTPSKGWELVDNIDDALLFAKVPKKRKWPWVSAGVLAGCIGYLVSTV